jgi:hypothetical protein
VVDVFRRSLVLGLLLGLAVAAPAHAVVGGKPISPSAARWFVSAGICGGTLIAPDRVATAAHCTDPIDMSDFESIKVGREVRRGLRVALPASWPTRRPDRAGDDVAIIQLDRPVTSVRPVPVLEPGARLPARLRILGQGTTRPGGPTGRTPLREATLRTVGDADCERRWNRSRSKYRNNFRPTAEVCAIDADGRAPFDSVCAGDSGGPIVAGTLKRPVLVGIISWAGERCGADRLPTVAAEASHFRTFLTAPEPVWAPVAGGPPVVTRDGATLTCSLPAWIVAPDRIDYRWQRRVRGKDGYDFSTVGTGPTYVPVTEDRGQLLSCQALGSNAGGRTVTPFGPDSSIRVE